MGAMSAPPPRKPRPPLPAGPFLVVGMARSGVAAARMLAERGEAVVGVDSAHPDGAAGLSAEGVEVVLDTDGLAQLEEARTVVKSPGVPRGGAGDRGGAGAGSRCNRRARARLAGDPEPLPRGHRDQRQDDHRRAARPYLPHRRRARRRRRQCRHAALLARRGGRSMPMRPSSARRPVSSSRTLPPSPQSAGSSSTSRPITLIATPTSTPTWRRSCASLPTRATTTSPSTTPTTRRWLTPTSGAAHAGSLSAAAPRPSARWRWPKGRSSTTASH